MKHQFHNKKTSYQDFKTPKKLHSPHPRPAANRRGRSHEGNSESAPSLPPCLSLSPLANFPTYARTTNVQTLKLLLCALYRLYCTSTILAPVPQTQLAQYRGKKQEAVLAHRHNILSKHSLPTTQPQTRDRRALF